MTETISVQFSGPVLSLLLYENSKKIYGQEGFLLGEIFKKETKTITDNDQRQTTIMRLIKINSLLPCPSLNYFYNGIGRIDRERLNGYLNDQKSNVVAWYKYKPVSGFKFTFRERIVHKQLAECFNLPYEHFTCCLLTEELSDNLSTSTYRQNFIRYNTNGHRDQLNMRIANLSDPKNAYRNAEPPSDTIKRIMGAVEADGTTTNGLATILRIQDALHKHTEEAVKEMQQIEAHLFALEQQVDDMRKSTLTNTINGETRSPIIKEINKEKDTKCTKSVKGTRAKKRIK